MDPYEQQDEENEVPFTDAVSTAIGENVRSISKKSVQQGVGAFKLHKKLGQGIKVLVTQEKKKFEDVVTQQPKKDVIVMHFGNGDEYDFSGLQKFLVPYGECEIHIFPGVSYGIVQFKTLEQAEKLIKDSVKVEDNIVANSFEVPFFDTRNGGEKIRHVFFFYSNIDLKSYGKFQSMDFPNATRQLTIPGLKLLDEFITEEYENEIVKSLDLMHKWYPMNNRRVMHFGYEFLYGANNVDNSQPIEPFPEFFKPLMDKLNELCKEHGQEQFDQCTINDYAPGQGIPAHVDSHSPFEEMFLSISLVSGVVMSFRNQKFEQKHLFFPKRGVVVFTGEARYAWYHSIAQRKVDKVDEKLIFRKRRISLTFRKLSKKPCKCPYPYFCDSQGYDPNEMKKIFKEVEEKEKAASKKKQGEGPKEGKPEAFDMKEKPAEESAENKIKPSDVERKYVYNTYEKIAPHFSHTRYKPWPKVADFLNSLEKGSIVLDIGCGNGKYLGVNQDLYSLGTDRSENFMEICKSRDINFQVFSADSLRLPLRNGCADGAISIAVIHHFSTKELRVHAVREMARVVRPGGRILIYVWAFEQDTGKKFDQQDVLVPWHLQYKYEDQEKMNNLLNETHKSEGKESVEGKEKDVASTQATGDNAEESKEEPQRKKSKTEAEEDIFVDESKQSIVYKRYYHMFIQGELEEVVGEVAEVEIEQKYYDHANWCVILKRK